MTPTTLPEMRAALAEYDAAPRGAKMRVLDRYGVERHAVIAWRRAVARGMPPKAVRRRSPEEKRAILAEYDAAPTGERRYVLARHGVNWSHLPQWRRQLGVMTYADVRAHHDVPGWYARSGLTLRDVARLAARGDRQRELADGVAPFDGTEQPAARPQGWGCPYRQSADAWAWRLLAVGVELQTRGGGRWSELWGRLPGGEWARITRPLT